MTLPSSGPLSLSQIQSEFGGTNPISLSEYYGAASGIPSSGAISISQFYGKSATSRQPSSGYYRVGNGFTAYGNPVAGDYFVGRKDQGNGGGGLLRMRIVWNGVIVFESTDQLASMPRTISGWTYHQEPTPYSTTTTDFTGGQGAATTLYMYGIYRIT